MTIINGRSHEDSSNNNASNDVMVTGDDREEIEKPDHCNHSVA